MTLPRRLGGKPRDKPQSSALAPLFRSRLWGSRMAGTFLDSERWFKPGRFPSPSVLTQPGNSPGRVCDGPARAICIRVSLWPDNDFTAPDERVSLATLG